MGVSSSDVASSTNAFIAQRLVRQLCSCKEKISPTTDEKEKIENVLRSISQKAGVEIPSFTEIHKPRGCSNCNGIGYKGRLTVMEVLAIDRDIQELINRGAITNEIQDKAVENGMITMAQDGILKVLEGLTTIEEVERVTDL
jgi:type II secretory ATPase GspE/PulE/Tfp pilus assembly ATPase PilB-like protein